MHTQLINDGCTHLISPYSDNLAHKLYWASESGRDQEVLELLQRGAPPNNSDYYTRERGGDTPLHMACIYNHLRSAVLLIKFGAIVAATNIFGWTPLHSAYVHIKKDIAKLLLEHHCPTGELGVSPAVSVGVCHLVQVCGSDRHCSCKASQYRYIGIAN